MPPRFRHGAGTISHERFYSIRAAAIKKRSGIRLPHLNDVTLSIVPVAGPEAACRPFETVRLDRSDEFETVEGKDDVVFVRDSTRMPARSR